MPFVIAQPCIDVKDGVCLDVCPVDCIESDDTQFYIDPSRCIDCNACALYCPVNAIFSTYDLPEEWAHYKKLNADFFKRD